MWMVGGYVFMDHFYRLASPSDEGGGADRLVWPSIAMIFLTACGSVWHHPSLPQPQQEALHQAMADCNQVAKLTVQQQIRINDALRDRSGYHSVPSSQTSVYGGGGGVGIAHSIDFSSSLRDWFFERRIKEVVFGNCMNEKGWVTDSTQ